MLELWGMWNTPSFPSLPGSLRPGVVVPDRVLSIDQIELNCTNAKLNICIKMDLALNNLQWLMYHKTKPNQTWLIEKCYL